MKHSRMLFVNNKNIYAWNNRYTAASLFLWKEVKLMEDNKNITTLRWFCEKELETSGGSAHQITLGLLLQLFQGSTELSIPAAGFVFTPGRVLNLLLEILRQQLQKTPVFCYIDCIHFCEVKERKEDTKELLQGLEGLVNQSIELPGAKAFKVLVTHSSSTVSEIGPNETVQWLDVPRSEPAESSGSDSL